MSSSSAEIHQTLQARFRAFREMRGLTQGELGARAGMAAASISHFETGQRVPSLDSLVKLADALEVSVDALLGRTSAENASQLDPVFLRASQASAQTLDTVRRVTEALLASMDARGEKS
jgi:transcriptional regulator with XRE-family HTH domain